MRVIVDFVNVAIYRYEQIIVRALEANALADVNSWERVAPQETSSTFSTWRGSGPAGYDVIGHFFVTGNEPPMASATAGIKAIRKDLIKGSMANYQIWEDTATKVTLRRDDNSDNSYISCNAFISQQDHHSNPAIWIGLLSKLKAEEMTPEAEARLFFLLQALLGKAALISDPLVRGPLPTTRSAL